MASLKGKTLFVSGGSRGIGLSIALRAARDGANIALAAKTAEPHPKLRAPSTPPPTRSAPQAARRCRSCAISATKPRWWRRSTKPSPNSAASISAVNNASAISLTDSQATDMKRFDLMMGINTRGTFMVSKYCIPHLKKANNPLTS